MRKSWMPYIVTFAVGIAVGLVAGYSKSHEPNPAEDTHGLFIGQTVSISQPSGPPGSNQFSEQRFRIVRIHSMRQDRTPEDRQFEGKFTGWRMTFWDTPNSVIAFAEPE